MNDSPPKTSIPESLCALIDAARAIQASDLHLDPHEGVAVRVLRKIERLPHVVDDGDLEVFLSATLDPVSRMRFERMGNAAARYADPRVGRLRLCASRMRGGIRLAVRLLPAELPELEALLLPDPFSHFAKTRSGIVIVAGPAASGKTTAAIALLLRIRATCDAHLVSLERNIEYPLAWGRSIVSQYQVGRDVATFEEGIRAALRSDADAVFAGEVPGVEALVACLEAAESGRLVLAAFESVPETPQVLNRLIELFPADDRERGRRRLADALRGILGLRLVPTLGGNGLRPASELLLVNEPVRRHIREGAPYLRKLISSSARDGMLTLETSLSTLVGEGAIDLATARSFSQYPDEVYAPPKALRA